MRYEVKERYAVPYDISHVRIGEHVWETARVADRVGYTDADLKVTDRDVQDTITHGYPNAISFGDAMFVMLHLLHEGRAEIVTDDLGYFDHWVIHPIPAEKSADMPR